MSGLDLFAKEFARLKNVPLGILSNHASLSSNGFPAAFELLRQGFSLKKIFTPEHGVSAQGEDGKPQPDGHDVLTGLPVISLYGKTHHPREEDLHDVELILIDLPNIGCRFYTYWWTISCMLETCGTLKKRTILLDRPNLTGRTRSTMEGPMLDEASCRSFLGRWRMPLTYAHSYGELARWFVKERNLAVPLQVVNGDALETDRPFIPTSPSMPTLQSALIYPCTGLFEGLNLNTGRGTSYPFRVVGAPWIDAVRLCEDFREQNFPGVSAYPHVYRPEWSRYAGSVCHGLYLFVNDPDTFMPVRTGIWLMNHISVLYQDNLTPGLYPTVANPDGENHLDLLLGVKNAYATFCSGKEYVIDSTNQLLDVSAWTTQVDAFLEK